MYVIFTCPFHVIDFVVFVATERGLRESQHCEQFFWSPSPNKCTDVRCRVDFVGGGALLLRGGVLSGGFNVYEIMSSGIDRTSWRRWQWWLGDQTIYRLRATSALSACRTVTHRILYRPDAGRPSTDQTSTVARALIAADIWNISAVDSCNDAIRICDHVLRGPAVREKLIMGARCDSARKRSYCMSPVRLHLMNTDGGSSRRGEIETTRCCVSLVVSAVAHDSRQCTTITGTVTCIYLQHTSTVFVVTERRLKVRYVFTKLSFISYLWPIYRITQKKMKRKTSRTETRKHCAWTVHLSWVCVFDERFFTTNGSIKGTK